MTAWIEQVNHALTVEFISMKNQRTLLLQYALRLAKEVKGIKIFLFLSTEEDCHWFFNSGVTKEDNVVLVLPGTLKIKDSDFNKMVFRTIRIESENLTRFSRIKYALLYGVMHRILLHDSKVVCVIGPSGKGGFDTIKILNLAHSWIEEIHIDIKTIARHRAFPVVLAVINIAIEIGMYGREGKSRGASFIIGDVKKVLKLSHQVVFNPFKGYSRKTRNIYHPEVAESVKELSSLDGAFILSTNGVVEAAGRHLDAACKVSKQLLGLGARHRSAAAITRKTNSIAVVTSESTGRVIIFAKGRIVSTLEPAIVGKRG